MPPQLFIDPESIDLDSILHPIEAIRETVPQRHEMEQLDAIHHFDPDTRTAVATRRVREDEWWVRGHIPGRPIFPGVLIVEAAAQLSTWLFKAVFDDPRFFGFAAIDDIRFRGVVQPGVRLVLIARIREAKSRRAIFDCQGVVDGRLVFQGVITGMAV